MRKYKIRYLLGLVLVVNLSFAAICDSAAKSKYRKLVEVENTISRGLLSTATVINDAKKIGVISQEDIDFLKPILKSVGETNLKVIEAIRAIPNINEIGISEQQKLISLINFLSTSLTELNDEGMLRIKDPTKRLLFNSIVLTMQNSATSVVRILNLKGN